MTQAERNKRIEEIRERCEKATKGPWWSTRMDIGKGPREPNVVFSRDDLGRCTYDTFNLKAKDADFIAHSRDDIPFLLAEIERLRQALELK